MGRLLALMGLFLLCSGAVAGVRAAGPEVLPFPLEMGPLLEALSRVEHEPSPAQSYPREVRYPFVEYDVVRDTLVRRERLVVLPRRPDRIVPHSVGIAEILWAICPRKRILAVHESCTEPRFSLLASRIPASFPTYRSQDAELVIGYRPDLVLTTYYSGEEFKSRLRLAAVPCAELGYFGDLASVEEQIGVIGDLIAEPAAARALVGRMREALGRIRSASGGAKGRRVLLYDEMGYVHGRHTTFDWLCESLGAVNVASAEGLSFVKQIDHETLLRWDPDLVVVPAEGTLEQQLTSQRILASARFVRTRSVRRIPNAYLMASSQYLVASVNYLAGLLRGR